MLADSDLSRRREAIRNWLIALSDGEDSGPAELINVSSTPLADVWLLTGKTPTEDPARSPSKLFLYDGAEPGLTRVDVGLDSISAAAMHPDGKLLACIGKVDAEGAQVWIHHRSTGKLMSVPTGIGDVESLIWSPSGGELWIIRADPGTAKASIEGAVTQAAGPEVGNSWQPTVDRGHSTARRRMLRFILANGEMVEMAHLPSVWELAACGEDHVAIIGSSSGDEDAWYSAKLYIFDLTSGRCRSEYRPARQVGALSSSPDGKWISIVESLASDRGSLAGELKIFDTEAATVQPIEVGACDVTWTGWSASGLNAAGIAGDTAVLLSWNELSAPPKQYHLPVGVGAGTRYPKPAISPDGSRWLVCTRSICEGSQLIEITAGEAVTRHACARKGYRLAQDEYGTARLRPLLWTSGDGLEVDGWLHTPPGTGPFPMVVMLHGGPVSRWLPRSLADMALSAMLASEGIAQFYPNPRGSTGRGGAFRDAILGQMGIGDGNDVLFGIRHLIDTGVADPSRIGMTGISHGGFLSAWLATQAAEMGVNLAACAPVCPITDWRLQGLTTNIPSFNALFLRSQIEAMPDPVDFADRIDCPMLIIAGALDSCTPASQAEVFHRALRAAGKSSELVIYPQEGHSIRGFEARIDYTARLTQFFAAYLRNNGK